MPGSLERDLIGGDFGIEFFRFALDLGFEFGDIQPRARRRPGQMIAFVPVLRAAPDQPRNLIGERQRLAPPRRCLAEPGQAEDVRLFLGDLVVAMFWTIGSGRGGTNGTPRYCDNRATSVNR